MIDYLTVSESDTNAYAPHVYSLDVTEDGRSITLWIEDADALHIWTFTPGDLPGRATFHAIHPNR
jgi:hypothetical protein